MRKPDFCLCENKGADQLRGNPKLISAFVFATRIVQFLFYLNPKFQASSSFLSLYRPVCVGPGRKSRRPVFSRRGSHNKLYWLTWVLYLKHFFDVMTFLCLGISPIKWRQHRDMPIAVDWDTRPQLKQLFKKKKQEQQKTTHAQK